MSILPQKPDIVSILEKEGIELRQRGRHFWACCPLHAENTPSFCVDPRRQRFKCFGCQASGDVIDFIRRSKGFSFGQALQHLGLDGSCDKPSKLESEEMRYRKLVKAFNRWIDSYTKECCDLVRISRQINATIKTPEMLDMPEIENIYLIRDIAVYHLSVLESDDMESKLNIWREITRDET
ncbi:MAG: hypothetical protein E3K32_11845 [wastewater metagenome]|nr:hypothetical protein [Candidatus Loosdrechtia aerotolerans]